MLCSWLGRPARPRTQHDCHHDTKVKPGAATAVIEPLMMGGKTPETCWAVNKRQDNKLKNCCIRLVIYLNCTMMHGLKNLKFYISICIPIICLTPILDKLLAYKRNWIQHVNRMPHNRLPRVMKRYSPTGRRNHGTPLKRLLDTWDRNGSTSGPTPWQIYDDDDDVTLFKQILDRATSNMAEWKNTFFL